MDIYAILSSKPHNKHYLDRYHKFIQECCQRNSLKTKEELGYTEKHHICPRSKDLFPEYASFAKNPWNSIILNAKQHYIAHHLLWKAYGGTQAFAFRTLKNVNGIKINASTYEKLRNATSGNNAPRKNIKHSEETKKKISNTLIAIDHNKDRNISEETKRKMSESKRGMYTGNKHPLFDHKIYTFYNIKSEQIVKCTRFDFRKEFYNGKKDAKLFPIGKISRGWKIIDIQEVS